MENFHQHFSSEILKNLEILKNDLHGADAFSDAKRLELFRFLHTVKGNSQTFGFTSAARLAHELENLLAPETIEFFTKEKFKSLFVEGIDLLVKSLRQKNFVIPATFIEEIRAVISQTSQPADDFGVFEIEIPSEISSQLSNQEKTALISSLNGGKNLYVFEIGFDLSSFAGKFKEFRELLSHSGEIFAQIPSRKFKQSGKIGFQIVLTSVLPAEQIQKIGEKSGAELISGDSAPDFSIDLPGILAKAVKHGKNVAEKLGKQVEFVILADEAKLSSERLKLVFDVLLHLIRNAVDHAFERIGKIEIVFKVEKDWLKLSVADNGRGIDSGKIKSRAVGKNLISAGENLSERETLDLIFLPEFSTASKITEISGRGIGLDAVKNAVEKVGGKINVKSRIGNGTTFEIFLPTEAANRSENLT